MPSAYKEQLPPPLKLWNVPLRTLRVHLSEPGRGLSLQVGAKCPLLLESLDNRSKTWGLSSSGSWMSLSAWVVAKFQLKRMVLLLPNLSRVLLLTSLEATLGTKLAKHFSSVRQTSGSFWQKAFSYHSNRLATEVEVMFWSSTDLGFYFAMDMVCKVK